MACRKGVGWLMDVDRLEAILARGHDLSGFDAEAVRTVAALVGRLRDAAAIIADEGSIIDDRSGVPVEHPAVKVERMCSAELRGWVKDRPDLFGAVKSGDGPVVKSGRDRFKAVAG